MVCRYVVVYIYYLYMLKYGVVVAVTTANHHNQRSEGTFKMGYS